MGSRPILNHEPTRSEVACWRQLAAAAGRVATGQAKGATAWRELRALAAASRRLTVFGQNGHGNVCILLIEEVFRLADSVAVDKPLDELGRFAHEVLRRCDAFDEIRKVLRHG
jgi:hypothetical protein